MAGRKEELGAIKEYVTAELPPKVGKIDGFSTRGPVHKEEKRKDNCIRDVHLILQVSIHVFCVYVLCV